MPAINYHNLFVGGILLLSVGVGIIGYGMLRRGGKIPSVGVLGIAVLIFFIGVWLLIR